MGVWLTMSSDLPMTIKRAPLERSFRSVEGAVDPAGARVDGSGLLRDPPPRRRGLR